MVHCAFTVRQRPWTVVSSAVRGMDMCCMVQRGGAHKFADPQHSSTVAAKKSKRAEKSAYVPMADAAEYLRANVMPTLDKGLEELLEQYPARTRSRVCTLRRVRLRGPGRTGRAGSVYHALRRPVLPASPRASRLLVPRRPHTTPRHTRARACVSLRLVGSRGRWRGHTGATTAPSCRRPTRRSCGSRTTSGPSVEPG